MLSSLRCFLGIAIGTIHGGTHHGTSWPNKNSFPKGLKGLEEVIYIQVPGIVWEAGKRSFRTTWETNPPIRHYLSMTLPTNMYKNGMNMSRWSKYSIDVCLVQQLWYVLMNISRWTKSVVFVCCCGIPWEVLESFCMHGDLDLIWIWDRDLSSQDCQDNPKHHWVLSVFLSSFYMFFIIIFNCTVYRR